MRLSKINPILAIALASVLATAILPTQLSSLSSLIHAGHNNNASDPHSAEAVSFPLPIDFHYKIKEKAGDAADGNKYVEIDENFIDSDNSCEFCVYIKVKPGPKGETGFVYVVEEGLDLSTAKSVTFFVMGLDGGEKLKFNIAGKTLTDKVKKGGDVKGESNLFKDKKFALTTEEVTLENDWLPFSIDLTDVPKDQLTGVTHPFAIEMSKIKGEQEFYIKHIMYKTEEAELNTLTTTAEAGNATLSNVTAVNATEASNGNTTDGTANATNDGDNATDGAASSNNSTETQAPEQSEDTPANDTDSGEGNDTATTIDTENIEADSVEDNSTAQSAAVEEVEEENAAPTAKANDDIIAYPGDKVILDGLASFDEDGDELVYKWTQSDGPDLEIADEDTATPTVTIPSDIDEDGEAVIDLVVSDGKAESEKYSLTIIIDYVEPLVDDSDPQIQTQELMPDDMQDSEWATECNDLAECLSDDNEDTFASTGNEGEEDLEKTDLLSFEDLEVEENEDAEIKQVILQVDATKSGETGYVRFIVDDAESFKSNLVSIASEEEEMSEYRLVLDKDPVTDDEWTVDSINSIVAGYAYGGGEGGEEVKIAAMKLIVIYVIVPSEVTTEEDDGDDDDAQSSTEEEEDEEESDIQSTTEDSQEEDSSVNEDSNDEEGTASTAVQGNNTGGDSKQVNSEEEQETE